HFFTRTLGVEPANLEWHGHNDFHRGEVNTMAAWLYGCAAANGSLFGFGERTGNPPLEALVIDYLGLTGDATGVDTTAITRAAAYFRDELGTPLPANHPFAGAGFNVTSAGIHADGLLKNEEIYNIFDTARILDRPLGITVNDRSGLAGIAYWLNTTLGLGGPAQVRKDDPRVVAIHREVERQYAAGRSTGFSPDEMAALARVHFRNAPAAAAALVLVLTPRTSVEKMVPATVDVYAVANLDPSLSQKVNLLRAVHRFPDTSTDQKLGEQLDKALKDSGITFSGDIQPWLGAQVGLAVRIPQGNADPPVALFAVSKDDSKAVA